MRITAINGYKATCEARGSLREVSLFMLQYEDLAPGDLVMVHLSRALEKMSEEQARLAWEAYDEILALEQERAGA
jgi:hydrogenase expression/formation protein HypC